MKVLMISAPGDDRGPGTMYKNHIRALAHRDSNITQVDLTQELWGSERELRDFDAAWGYVRFHPLILNRMRSLGIPVIGGPNIAMERADAGITDEYESWYLTQPSVDVNLNVAAYYRDHVKKFASNGMRCEVLEGCYDVESLNFTKSIRDIDVLLYQKIRVNDSSSAASQRLNSLESQLKSLGLRTETIHYGSHTREEYFSLCRRSKTVAWLSIEDYASIAQIEAHLLGACVVGTPYNLTIPSVEESHCFNSQKMKDWIEWEDCEKVSDDYTATIRKILNIDCLDEKVHEAAAKRHGFTKYREELSSIIGSLK